MKHRMTALLLAAAMLLCLLLVGCDNPKAVITTVAQTPYDGKIVGDYESDIVKVNNTKLHWESSIDSDANKLDPTIYNNGADYAVEWYRYNGDGWDKLKDGDVITMTDENGDCNYYLKRITFEIAKKYKGNVSHSNEGSGYIIEVDQGVCDEWLVCEVWISFKPNDEFAAADAKLYMPQPLAGYTVEKAISKITFFKNTYNLYYTDSTDYYNPEIYEYGGAYAVQWLGHLDGEAGVEIYENDHVLSESDKFSDKIGYDVYVYYMLTDEYGITYFSSDSNVEYDHPIAWTDEGEIHCARISCELNTDVTEGSLYVPQPVYGETVAETNDQIIFRLGDGTLTYTDSTDYKNPETYADGTCFAVDWNGNVGNEPDVIDYEPDHVFSEEDVPGGGCSYTVAFVHYAAPVGESCNVYIGSTTVEIKTADYVETEKDGWVIYTLQVRFESGREPEAIPEVELHVPALYYLTTPNATNQEIGVSVNGNALAWAESIKDPETDFRTNWLIADSTDFTTAEFTNLMSNYLFNGSGEIYVVRIYFNTPYVRSADLNDGYVLSYEIEEGGDFDVEVRNVGGFSSDPEETYMINGVDVIYTQKPGHVHNMEEVTGTAATCTENGTSERRCTVCGVRETLTVDALGHSWGAWTESGSYHVHTCSRCGAQETGTHSCTMQNNAKQHWDYCSICGATLNYEYHDFDLTGNVYNEEGTSTKLIYTCTVCGYLRYEDIIF